MWPLSWYPFCVSLPLEVRTVGLVLFLQVLTLLSVLLCLPPAGHVEPVFSDSVFSAAVRRNNRELHNTEKKVLFATCAAPVPRYTRHDLLSLETAAAPPPFPSPQLIACLSHLGIARNVPRKPRRSRRGGKNERRKIKVIVGFRDRVPSDSSSSPPPPPPPPPTVVSRLGLTFIVSIQLSFLTLTSSNMAPLPCHQPLHPVTVTTSQPPRCFTLPLVLIQPKTHSLSTSSMQDPSALPGGGSTFPPSFRTTLSTSCGDLAAPCR